MLWLRVGLSGSSSLAVNIKTIIKELTFFDTYGQDGRMSARDLLSGNHWQLM